MNKFFTAAAAVFALSASPSFAATNIVVDPGFENAPAPAGSYTTYGFGQTFGGWTVVGADPTNSSLVLSSTYAEPGVAFPAHSGANSVDLTAAGNTGPTNGIFQNLSTAIGQTYDVSFWLGNATGAVGGGNTPFYALPSSVTLTIGGGIGELFTNSAVTLGSVNWQRYTTSFTATGLTTQLLFTNSTPGADNYAGLDDVSVSAAPEPGTWLMMILGFGMVGSALRLRGRRPVAA